jgi:hypothetical protein
MMSGMCASLASSFSKTAMIHMSDYSCSVLDYVQVSESKTASIEDAQKLIIVRNNSIVSDV